MSERRLRILFFLNSAVRGGVEEVVLALVKGLDRERFEVHLAAPAPLVRSFQPDLNGCAVEVLEIGLASWRQLKEIKRFVRYLRERRIQIVNSHLFYATLFAAPLARLAGVPAVIETNHGPESWRRSWWKRTFWVDRLVERLVSANIAVSEAVRHYLVTRKRYPAHKIRVAPNGRDLTRYSAVSEEEVSGLRERYGLSPSDRVIAVVGRLEEQKGHIYLLQALPPVIQRFPNIKVVVVGDGSLRECLERTARECGLAAHVVFAGFHERVAPFYRLAEFVALPSLYEGMPLAAIEAGAAGRAMVATDVDGTREVVADGQTGLLVPPRSPEALAAALHRLLEDPKVTRAMGRSARQRVREAFSLERQIELTSQVYAECLAAAERPC